MQPKKSIPKIKLKTVSNRDVLNKIVNDENIKSLKLIKIFSYKHQKLHQLYSKNEDHIYNEDEQKYTSLFPKMKKYNQIYLKNISNYFQKKDENKNFLKEYMDFKKYTKEVCNDDINFLYGDLLPKYQNKNLKFSKKFLKGEKLFKENGLLMKKKRDMDDYYRREIKKNGKNILKTMRDILYMNEIYNKLENKRVKYNSVGKNALLPASLEVKKRKSCVADMIDIYKTSHAYKKVKREEAMKIAKAVQEKQKEIEDDKEYIKNISNLIEQEENLIEKQKTFYPNISNPFSLKKNKNNENENENTLFIINRYTKDNLRNFKSIFNDNPNLNKNKSSTNIHCTLNKEKEDTTISTFMNVNETKFSLFSRNNKNNINKKNSIKTTIDYSDYNLDNNNNFINNDYILIDDTSNPLKINSQKTKKLSTSIKNINLSHYSTNDIKMKIKNKIDKNKLQQTNPINDNNEELSSITNFNKTILYNSSLTNLSTKKNKKTSNLSKMRKTQLSYSVSKHKALDKNKLNSNDNEKKVNNFSIYEEDFDEKGLRWDLYKKYIGLKYKLESNNNHKLGSFCNSFSILPKIVKDKLDKSFELDEQIKESHKNYVKLLMEQKIKGFHKDKGESSI